MSGLPYGWWKDPDVWAFFVTLICLVGVAVILGWAWFIG